MVELRLIDPPSEKLTPGWPELVRMSVPGLSTDQRQRFGRVALVDQSHVGRGDVDHLVVGPADIVDRDLVAPLQVTLALVQLNAPVREIPTVAPDQVPGPSTIVPRSRFWTHASVSGLTMVAETVATPPGAARAGPAAARPPGHQQCREARPGSLTHDVLSRTGLLEHAVTAEMVYFRSTMAVVASGDEKGAADRGDPLVHRRSRM